MIKKYYIGLLIIALLAGCKDKCDDGPYYKETFYKIPPSLKEIIKEIVPITLGDSVRYMNSEGDVIIFEVTRDFLGFPDGWDYSSSITIDGCDGKHYVKQERREIELIDTTNTHKLTYRFDEVDEFEINYYKKTDSLSYEWIFGMDYRLTNDCNQSTIRDSVYYDTFGNDDQCRFVFKSGIGILNIFDYEIDLSSQKKKP